MVAIPFSPASTSTAGLTVKVSANATPTSVSGSIPATSSYSAIVVTNTGTVLVFVRLSAETTPTATATDYPLLPGTQITLTNPCAGARVGLAVLSSTTTAADIYFTPGEGE